jgi:phenylalanine-4-hydroxylase
MKNCSFALLPNIWQTLKANHPEDWLCALEILELLKDKKINDDFTSEVREFLVNRKSETPTLAKLINDGFAMLE